MSNKGAGFFLAASSLALAQPAQGGESVTYDYDSLGRLTRVSRAGSVNDGVNAHYCHDAADNRVTVTAGAGSSPPTCLSPPAPPPVNQAPVAVDDAAKIAKCISTGVHVAVLAEDYDPDGHVPLALLGAAYGGGLGTATVASADRVLFQPNGSGLGTAVVTYTMRDSAGATATGTLSVEIVQGQCP